MRELRAEGLMKRASSGGVEAASAIPLNPAAEPRIAVPAGQRPIFIHSLWRTGSTYVWSRFRAADQTRCFYEPLHDGLARLTPDRIGRSTSEVVEKNNHPRLAQPYFAEFAPLVAGRGVRGYQRRFAYDRFAMEVSESDAPLEAYLAGLIGDARGRQQVAVLGMNRSDLRIGWMRGRFQSYDISVDREPADVFSSYISQMYKGNYYYFTKLMQIVELNRDHEIFAPIADRLTLRAPAEQWLTRPKDFYRSVLDGMPRESLYALTLYIWAVRSLHALSCCDLVIDLALADRRGYRGELADRIAADCGLAVDFSDMQTAQPETSIRLAQQKAVETELLDILPIEALRPFIDRDRLARRMADLAPRKIGLLARAL
jgi:hypothetical protein